MRKLVSKSVTGSASTYVGNAGEIFYDAGTATLKLSNGVTAGGNVISGISSTDRLVNGVHTLSLGSNGTLTFPNGTLKITDSVISNLNVVGSLSTGSQIQVGNGITSSTGIIISNGTTDDLTSSRSLINVNGNNASMMLQVANSLGGGGPTLTGQQLVEVGSSNVVIGLRVIESGAGTTFSGWTFNGQAGTLTFPNGTTQTTAWKGIPGPYADDEAATLAGVALGSPYHKTGTGGQVFVRLTSPT